MFAPSSCSWTLNHVTSRGQQWTAPSLSVLPCDCSPDRSDPVPAWGSAGALSAPLSSVVSLTKNFTFSLFIYTSNVHKRSLAWPVSSVTRLDELWFAFTSVPVLTSLCGRVVVSWGQRVTDSVFILEECWTTAQLESHDRTGFLEGMSSWWWARQADDSYLKLLSYSQELFSLASEC